MDIQEQLINNRQFGYFKLGVSKVNLNSHQVYHNYIDKL